MEIVRDTVVSAARESDGFILTTGAGARHRAHILVLATGLTDELPDVPGAAELFGPDIAIYTERVAAFEGASGGGLARVLFAGGETLPRDAAFFHSGCRPRSPLAAQLGCRFTAPGRS